MSSHGWSEWAPHPTTANCEYRYRYDEKGVPVYDYRQNTPRSGVDEAMRNLNLSDPQEQEYSASSTNYEYRDQTTSQTQSRRAHQSSGSAPYGSSGQYPGSQYAASQPQYSGSEEYAGGGIRYSEPQYGGTQTYDTNAAGYMGSQQYGGLPQYPSARDLRSPRHTHATPVETQSSTRRRQDPQRHSHRRRDKGKESSVQAPTDPFYPNYYSSDQTPGTSYYSAPTQDAYPTGAGAEDTELDNPGDFGGAVTGGGAGVASSTPSSVTPVAEAQDPPKSTVDYDDSTYSTGDLAEDPGEEDPQYMEDLERAKIESRRIYDDPFAQQGSPSAGGSSSYEAGPAYTTESAYGEGSAYSLNPDAYDAPDDFEYGGTVTPRALSPSEKITGTAGDRERLDYRFRLHNSPAFDLGRIFKVLWADPKGGGNVTEDATDTMKLKNSYGESFYVGIRRFIIIASDEGNSTCVPILTYRGLGCRKNGVKARMHGIIYGNNDRSSKRAKPLDNEPKMGFPPVCMKVTAPGEKLARESRVNYAKLVTIEHNVKVFFIGKLEGEDFEIARDAVDKCWTDKIREPKKRRH